MVFLLCTCCRDQISKYEADRLKVQQLSHLQEAPAQQQVCGGCVQPAAGGQEAGQQHGLLLGLQSYEQERLGYNFGAEQAACRRAAMWPH